MKNMFKFPSIEQFASLVKNVRERSKFVGLDDNGKAIFDQSKVAPKLSFHGTVKLHGTNASVCFNQVDGLWCQSRENIITPEKDNAGFAFYVESNKFEFLRIINQFSVDNQLDLSTTSLCIYGEWCGGSIQKGVALNQLPKMFVVFGVKLMTFDGEESTGTWLDHSSIKDETIRCYNIEQFPTYEIEIDFENPSLSQNKLIDMTIAVEDECPVGKHFGVSGIGEGIVFSHVYEDGTVLRFKSKGERHASSKVKTLKVVDDAKEQLKLDIAEKVTPDWRVDQAIQEVFDTNNNGVIDIKKIGDVIKWVNQDIMKEELHVFAEAGLEPKEVMSKVAQFVKTRFFTVMNENLV
jgi:hypothetical protein